MSLPGLFLKEVANKGDLSLTKLPQDMDVWAEEIVSKIKEKLPGSKDLLMKVTFLAKNEELGTATGSATVHDQKLNKSIYVPLIVKNFSLYPLDVMIVPKKTEENGLEVVPLTREYFNEAMMNNDVFNHLERPIDRIQQLYMNPQNSVTYPPYFRNVYASAQVFDSISDTINPSDKEEMLETIKSNKDILIGYEKRSNVSILQKIADSKILRNERQMLPVNISAIKKDVEGGFKICYTSDEVFDPVVEEKNPSEMMDYLGKITDNVEETLNQVKRNGEYIVFNDLKPKEDAMVFTHNKGNYLKVDEDPVDVKVFGSYRVMDKNGVQHKGLVIPNVVDFNQKLLGVKIFYNGNKTAYQDKIVGIPTGAEPQQFFRFKYPEVGITGTFVTLNEKNAVATIPVTVRSVMDDTGYSRLVVEDINGKKIKIKFGVTDHSLMSHSEEIKEKFEAPGELKQITKIKDFYLVPQRFLFLPLGNFCELHSSPGSMYMKTASKVLDATPVRVIYTGANQFALKGPDIQKMASLSGMDHTNLSATDAIFLLTAKKASLTKTSEALKTAARIGESSIHHLPSIMFKDQYDKVMRKQAEAFDKYVRVLKVNLVKEAASIDDSQVVDAALSLNFINSDNIDKFMSFIPYFNECIKMLAQTLLASRVGMKEIPEHDTQSAMFKMIEVVRGLERLNEEKIKD